jgi:hypothetical protein
MWQLVRSVLRWLIFLVFLWVFLVLGLQLAAYYQPEQAQELLRFQGALFSFGAAAGQFFRNSFDSVFAPIIQFGLIALILIWIAERLGLLRDGLALPSFASFSTLTSSQVQAFIAVIIISSFSLVALWRQDVSALKDIGLVVVGFYFGTRRRQTEIEDAVATGTAAGIAASQAPPADAQRGVPSPSGP